MGITLDRSLSFRQHVRELRGKIKKRTNTVRAVSGKNVRLPYNRSFCMKTFLYRVLCRSLDATNRKNAPGKTTNSLKRKQQALYRLSKKHINNCACTQVKSTSFRRTKRHTHSQRIWKDARGTSEDPIQAIIENTITNLRRANKGSWMDKPYENHTTKVRI